MDDPYKDLSAFQPKGNTKYDPDSGLPLELTCLTDNMDMILVPASKFIMGTGESECKLIIQLMQPWAARGTKSPPLSRSWFAPEMPQREISLDAFYIDKCEVTNTMYKRFCEATGYIPPSHWHDGNIPQSTEYHPATNVSWHDALHYAQWVDRRLPTESEWEKAARGTDARLYPWGNQISHYRLHYILPYTPDDLNNAELMLELSKRQSHLVANVDDYPTGASPYGVLDMLGNVWEWTQDWYDKAYYNTAPIVNPTGPTTGTHRVIRGGGSSYDPEKLRCAYRARMEPDVHDVSVGFRCAVSAVHFLPPRRVDLPTAVW
jgi:formylglycine-generating enzyme required for sulfatase activity